ncbi:MAG TPA: cysteine hydrolase family protein [Terriglobales bacterium]|jgi:nicotinamidase/pyrazinamidase|nr:cysteine hydrolase family protein [Terriglobales bacterium]
MIFWDVDTQIDFMRPEGKLYVAGAEKIVSNLKRLTSWARQNKILIVASQCAHREGDEEFKLYPPHCLVGTPGQAKIPETVLPKRNVIPNRPAEVPDDPHEWEQVIVEKQQFDVFTNPNTEALLKRLGRSLDIVVYGVVTEICVACAARGLLDRGHRVTLVRDAIQHIDEAKGRALIEEVERRGGRVVTTNEALSAAA